MRFPIRFDAWYSVLSSLLLLPPSAAYVEVERGEVDARMSWAFRSRFPRSAVKSASILDMNPLSRGVHGFAGRWLVNGAGPPFVRIALEPPQPASVMGFPIRLRELIVSVADAQALIRALLER